jgi:hypothetical protein
MKNHYRIEKRGVWFHTPFLLQDKFCRSSRNNRSKMKKPAAKRVFISFGKTLFTDQLYHSNHCQQECGRSFHKQ